MDNLTLFGKVINCPFCHTNTVLEEDVDENTKSYLCIKCGYTSTSKFTQDCKDLKKSPKLIYDTKKWDSERNIYWILSVINVPSIGILFPELQGDNIVWNYIPMEDIPDDQQINYPMPNSTKFYTKKLNYYNNIVFTRFFDGLKKLGAIIDEPSYSVFNDLHDNSDESFKI